MIPERASLERRVLTALDANPSRIPILLGGCGTGRTSVLLRLRQQLGPSACQYVDVERIATTPERFLGSLLSASPFSAAPRHVTTAQQAFGACLDFLSSSRNDRGGATFLLDEILELRTFESFPGLRSVLRDLVAALPASPNRFVMTTRYINRALRLLRDASPRYEVIQVPPLASSELRTGVLISHAARDRDELAETIHLLADGRPVYAGALAETVHAMETRGGGDPVSALAALLAPGARLFAVCRYTYELRLHRARGYGALKAILDVLARQEPLTLTEIALRLHRTPGSTKDYLSWLEDVDLVTAHQKKYTFCDPVLRLWVRLHCRPIPPSDDETAREVQDYAMARLPLEAAPLAGFAHATTGGASHAKPWRMLD